jgi:centromere protein S
MVGKNTVQKHEMQISPHVMTALADLTFKYAEELAKDVELFAHHAGRKSVMVDDVLLAAHRNEDVVAKLRAFARSLTRSREHQPEKKRKRAPTKEPDACA